MAWAVKDIPELTVEIKRRFWSKVEINLGGCWLWQASTTPLGYGKFGIGHFLFYAHRVSFWQAYGLQPGPILDHFVCSNPSCINPLHLRESTHSENERAGSRVGPERDTHCRRGHLRAEYGIISDGRFRCRKCRVEDVRFWRARRRGRSL